MSKRIFLHAIVLCSAVYTAGAQNTFTLEEVIYRARTQSLAFKQTETKRETKFWQYRFYRSNYNPQIRLASNSGALYRNAFGPVVQQDGTIIYRPLNQWNPGVNLSLWQPIQWTGGNISMNSNYNYFNDMTNKARQWNGTPLNVQLNQPIFAFNPFKWDKMIEPIKYEESKREYAELMEGISRDAADYFFNVMTEQVNLQIARYNLANNDTIYKIEQGRYNIGTTSEDKLLQVELQLLRSQQDVAQANLNLRSNGQLLRSFIGLRSSDNLELSLPEEIPTVVVTEEEALEHAKETSSTYIAFERKKLEAKEAVAFARGQLYQVGITAVYGLNSVTSTFSNLYNQTTPQQMANLTFNIPIIDWGRRKSTMQTAYATKRLADYTIQQDEITFEQDVLTQVRQFEMLRLQIEITKKSDVVALKRYMVAQNRYLIGKIDITNLNIALTEKDNAKRAYIIALKNYWHAYYNLRKLTLFDFVERKYLYNPHQEE